MAKQESYCTVRNLPTGPGPLPNKYVLDKSGAHSVKHVAASGPNRDRTTSSTTSSTFRHFNYKKSKVVDTPPTWRKTSKHLPQGPGPLPNKYVLDKSGASAVKYVAAPGPNRDRTTSTTTSSTFRHFNYKKKLNVVDTPTTCRKTSKDLPRGPGPLPNKYVLDKSGAHSVKYVAAPGPNRDRTTSRSSSSLFRHFHYRKSNVVDAPPTRRKISKDLPQGPGSLPNKYVLDKSSAHSVKYVTKEEKNSFSRTEHSSYLLDKELSNGHAATRKNNYSGYHHITATITDTALSGDDMKCSGKSPSNSSNSSPSSSGVVDVLNFYETLSMSKPYDDVKTPHEILARGPLAFAIYIKALEKGKTTISRLPVMFVGQERVGKTSLKKSLKGDRFNATEQCTKGIELDPSYCRVTTEIWRPERSNQSTRPDSAVSFDYHAAQLIARGLAMEEETTEAKSGASFQPTNNIDPETVQSFSSHEPQTTIRVTECEPEHEKPEMPDDVANLTHKFISEDIALNEEDDIHSILWDFGGQSVYYVTHPLFLTPRALYLLVYDLSQHPDGKANPVRKQGLFKELQDSFSSKTNLDYLDSWMSSVASLVSHDDEVPIGHLSEKLPKKLPPVFLVCTHADQPCSGRDSASVAAEILGSLQGKSYSEHLFDGVFAVDNTKSGSGLECPEVVRLRNEILAVAKELPQTNEEIPLKWLKFEKELQAKMKEGNKWIFLEEARQVAFEVCHISSEEEFVTLVKLLHDQRIIIHFDDTPKLNKMVVLDIQWLIDVLKKVITIEPYDGKGMACKDLWLKLEKTGILDEKLLEHTWGPLFDHKETSESLIEIMEKFSLLCTWPSSDEKKQYLVPSMLMSHPSEDILRLVKSSQLPSLYLTFNSSQMPIGLFPRMVLQFYQWCSKEWPSPCKPQFHLNFARFHISPEDGCSVILLCHSSFIEIVVHRPNDGVHDLSSKLQSMATESSPNLGSKKPDVIVGRAVRRQVGLMLECMPKEFVWLKNMKCEMKVLCSVCCPGGAVEYCEDHRIKSCKREECLHFWSEADLQNGQQFCDRSAVAGDPRLSLEQFAPWFTFLDEKQAVDGCAASELLSSEEEEAKALVLSTGILESLQSASDPCSVVTQLQESLELNQEALADPAPETTRLIRSFSVMAKCENRLDVVQRLRQITPAGTTGPLLPERLDVKAIPLPQMKALTITLSGGDEWTLLADKLGLTPAEIRYLNNRTMNPCLEALAHIRNHRFINVDTLYNALLECELPVLADLL